MVKFDFEFETPRNKKVYGIGRVPEKSPFQAICIAVHGYGEHCQRYEHVASHFVDTNIGFIGFDLLGHGKSDGKRGHILDIQEFYQQIQLTLALVKEKFPDLPVFLYGHSMGGNLVLNFLQHQKPDYLQGAIVASPWLRLAFEPPKWKVILGKLMAQIYPKYTDTSTLDTDKLSSDPSISTKYENDDLVHDQITAGLYDEITKGGESAIENASSFKLPTLLMHGTDDQITSFKATQEYYEKCENEELTFIPWENGRHELHNETNKNEVMKTMSDFMLKLTQKS